MLHDPLIAHCAEAVHWFPAEQQHAADDERRGTETDPDYRAYMHALIIGNVAHNCKHSRNGEQRDRCMAGAANGKTTNEKPTGQLRRPTHCGFWFATYGAIG